MFHICRIHQHFSIMRTLYLYIHVNMSEVRTYLWVVISLFMGKFSSDLLSEILNKNYCHEIFFVYFCLCLTFCLHVRKMKRQMYLHIYIIFITTNFVQKIVGLMYMNIYCADEEFFQKIKIVFFDFLFLLHVVRFMLSVLKLARIDVTFSTFNRFVCLIICCLTLHSTKFQLYNHVTVHRCAGRLKKKVDLRSGSQRHRHFVGFT